MTVMAGKIASWFVAPLAGVFLAGAAQAGLLVSSIDMYVAKTKYQVTESSDFTEALAVFDFAFENKPVCTVSVESFDSVGSVSSCGGPRKNTGTLFQISGRNTGSNELEFGLDWGRGGFSSVSLAGGSGVEKYTQDIWWRHNWNNKNVLNIELNETGEFTMLLLGFEACCNGTNSARWRSTDVTQGDVQGNSWETLAAVPAPPVMWLFGLGLVGLAASRRRWNI